MYDLLIVGAGITAATLAATLKHHLKILILDIRPHLAGNCFDHSSQGTIIHRYGPHIFHSPSPRITSFLSQFTDWTPYTHKVTAEVQLPVSQTSPSTSTSFPPPFQYVPFPYSRQTIAALGRELSADEILQTFFYGYSQKMWGMPWNDLPNSVRGRIPRDLNDTPQYYRHPFVALPRLGYTHMLENMLDGVEILLNAPPTEWTNIPAHTIIYTGRPDLIPAPGETVTLAEKYNLHLPFRTLDIRFAPEAPSPEWRDAICLHACSLARPWTRKTAFARMTGGHSPIVSAEFPHQATLDDPTPYYPIESPENQSRLASLQQLTRAAYPNLHLAGRLGTYRYFDMYQAVGQAISLSQKLFAPLSHSPNLQPAWLYPI
jgi:UDP-galactopyranose mutase